MTMADPTTTREPGLLRWAAKFAAAAGLTGMICCVAPAVLFLLGLMGGVYAISFASFFYRDDGSAGTGAWVLRGLAAVVGVAGIALYRRRQNQCSIDPRGSGGTSCSSRCSCRCWRWGSS